MGIDNIREQIIEEADDRAQVFMQEAEAEKKRIREETKKELAQYKEELETNAKKVVSVSERKEKAAAEFDGRRLLLSAKNDAINEVVTKTIEKLHALSKAKRQALLQKLLNFAQNEIEVDVVYVNKDDKDLVKGVTVKEHDMKGGLVAENKDGTLSVDLRYDTLLQSVREKNIQKLYGVLLGE